MRRTRRRAATTIPRLQIPDLAHPRLAPREIQTRLLPRILLLTYIVVNVNVYMYTIVVRRCNFCAEGAAEVPSADPACAGGRLDLGEHQGWRSRDHLFDGHRGGFFQVGSGL